MGPDDSFQVRFGRMESSIENIEKEMSELNSFLQSREVAQTKTCQECFNRLKILEKFHNAAIGITGFIIFIVACYSAMKNKLI